MTAESLSRGARPPTDDRPIRGELFSTERLEAFAEALAAEHAVSPGKRRGRPLLPRLQDNGRVLLASYRSIALGPGLPAGGAARRVGRQAAAQSGCPQ